MKKICVIITVAIPNLNGEHLLSVSEFHSHSALLDACKSPKGSQKKIQEVRVNLAATKDVSLDVTVALQGLSELGGIMR